jgi:hypothetical protein
MAACSLRLAFVDIFRMIQRSFECILCIKVIHTSYSVEIDIDLICISTPISFRYELSIQMFNGIYAQDFISDSDEPNINCCNNRKKLVFCK